MKKPPYLKKQKYFFGAASATLSLFFLLRADPVQAVEIPPEIPAASTWALKISTAQDSRSFLQPTLNSFWRSPLLAEKISSQIVPIQNDISEWRGSYKPFESLKFFQAVTYWHDVGFRPAFAPMVMDITYGTSFSCGAKFYALKTEKNYAGLLFRGKLLNATTVGSYNTRASMAFRGGLFFEHQLERKKILASLTHEQIVPDGSSLVQRNSFINVGFTWGER